MPEDLDVFVPVPGRRKWMGGWIPSLAAFALLLALPFLVGRAVGRGQPIGAAGWAFGAFFALASALNLARELSRLAAEPVGLLIRSDAIVVRRRGARWGAWSSPPDQVLPRESVEFLQGFGKLVLADRARLAVSLVLAEGRQVEALARSLAAQGIDAPPYDRR